MYNVSLVPSLVLFMASLHHYMITPHTIVVFNSLEPPLLNQQAAPSLFSGISALRCEFGAGSGSESEL